MRLPIAHKFAFRFASCGWRGSQFLWRFATILQKTKEGESIRLVTGFPLLTNSDDWISKTVYQGTYERALLKFLNGLEIADIYLDIGANIGVTLWHSLRNSKATATFMAFEPSTQCLKALSCTCSVVRNAGQIFDYAIGDSDSKGTLYGLENQAHSGAASLAKHPGIRGGAGEVQVHKLDTVLGKLLHMHSISLLKIDTEGYEAKVVDGAQETFRSGKVEILVMEVSPNFGSVRYLNHVQELLGDLYRWFYLDEHGRLRRTPYLLEIDLDKALNFERQWNLVLMRNDIYEKYKKSPGRIEIFTKNNSRRKPVDTNELQM